MPSESVSLKIVAKLRSLTEEEKNKGAKNIVTPSGNSVNVQAAGKEQSFSFDQVYGPEIKANQIFSDCVENLVVQRALSGYNVSVLALGTLSSGKSYLMAGSDDVPGIVPLVSQCIFQQRQKECFVTVTFVDILGDEMTDLLNPHTNEMKIREHHKLGIYVDGLSELVVHNEEDLTRFYVQGNRARKMGATDLKAHRPRSSGIFTIYIEQRDNAASKMCLRSKITLVDLAGMELNNKDAEVKSVNNVVNVLTAMKKGGSIPYRDSKLTRLLQDCLGGNSMTLLLACVSPLDKLYQDTMLTLQQASASRGTKTKVTSNLEESENMISELREEIARLRTKVTKTPDNKEDILKMEELIQDLQLAKKQTWEEKERRSSQYEEERRANLANKGVLEYVMESNNKGPQEQQEKIIELQREKDHLTLQYRDKRKKVDELKEELQKKITEYGKIAQSGKGKEAETKRRVTAIHELKDVLKRETEGLRDVKQRLKDAQERQRAEKDTAAGHGDNTDSAQVMHMIQSEERRRLEKENRAMLAEELSRVRMEAEQEKAEIQLRRGSSGEDVVRLECDAADARAEKTAVTLQLQMLQQEKELATRHLDDTYSKHKHQLEVQQLQHFQTFRQYREVFEQQKAVLEQRYRGLLEDAIQDAVFLSSRNTQLQTENDNLKQQLETTKLISGGDSSVRGDGGGRGCEVRADATYTIPEHKACKNCWHSKEIAEMKDKISLGGGGGGQADGQKGKKGKGKS